MDSVSLPEAQEEVARFEDILEALERPLVHGTTGDCLESILHLGLGAKSAASATCPEQSYVSRAREAGGLNGPYAFALRGGALGLRNGLGYDARRYGGRSVIARYVTELGMSGFQALIARAALFFIGLRYSLKRGRRQGCPLLLVYEGDSASLKKTNNGAPCDFQLLAPLPAGALRVVLAPKHDLAFVSEALQEAGTRAQLLPLEVLEYREALPRTQEAEQPLIIV